MTSEDSRYEAVRSRDARFDGVFFFAVATTGIYCRPSCPAVTPKRANVSFFATAAAAQGAGFRACRRCRPDAVPGSADWNARADVVGRAVRLIGDGVVDREGVAGLASRLGYSARQVQRQLTAELGAGPIALARAQRGHTARVLLQTTSMQAAEIAFAAGFASVRQFNETMREIYAATPTELRAGRPGRGHGFVPGRRRRGAAAAGLPRPVRQRAGLRLPGGPHGRRGGGGRRRRRARVPTAVRCGCRTARASRRWPNGRAPSGWLTCRLHLDDLRDLTTATQRIRRLFDLDADPYAVADRLGADPALAGPVARRPGLRAPGAADPEELAVRAVLAEGLPPARARRAADALAAAYGERLPSPDGGLSLLFPRPADLAAADLAAVDVPDDRRAAVRTVSAALVSGAVRLDPGSDRDEAEHSLLALPGVGPWTAGYVRMRALGDPDVLLDLRARGASAWRPWSSYAMHHLWCAARPAPRSEVPQP